MRRAMMVAARGVAFPLLNYGGLISGGLVVSSNDRLGIDLTVNGQTQGVGEDGKPSVFFPAVAATNVSAFASDTAIDNAFSGTDYLMFKATFRVSTTAATQVLFAKWDYKTDGSIAIELTNATTLTVFIAESLTSGGSQKITKTINIIAGTTYDIRVVYDGQQGVTGDRVKAYIDEVEAPHKANSLSIATSLPVGTISPIRLGNFGGTLFRRFRGDIQYASIETERP